jgi:hypothetical protein
VPRQPAGSTSVAEADLAFRYHIGNEIAGMAVCLLTVNGQESKAKDIIDIQARDIEPYLLEEFNKESITL